MKKQQIVAAIENGTVIDHIAPGKALDVVRILKLNHFAEPVALVMNVPSSKMGKKDVVKIANRSLSEAEVNEIALVAPNATLSLIKNFEVAQKIKLELPDIIHGVLECINPNCISRREGSPVFIVENKNPVLLRCHYCEHLITEEDL